MKLKTLRANPDNPRTITDDKVKALRAALEEFGDLGGFVYNRKSKQMVGGHQRLKAMPPDAEVTVVKHYKAPTKTGTVAEGYVTFGGEKFSYREVEWTKNKEKAANIAANKGAGEWDYSILGDWMQELGSSSDFNLDLTMFDENERKGFFSDLFEDDSEQVEKEEAHVEGFRDTIKVKVPKAQKAEVLKLLQTAINASKYRDAVEVVE